MDIDAVADQLYGLPPDEFTAARDQAAKDATDGDTRKAVKALRKPTVAARAVNALVRDRTDDIDALLALGEAMRAAMGGDPGEVRRLTAERRNLIGDLVDPDLPTATQQDVTATLEAATADPQLAAAVRSGRLVKPLRYAGFGTMPDLDDAIATPLRATAAKRPAETTKATTKTAPRAKSSAGKTSSGKTTPGKTAPAKSAAEKPTPAQPSPDLAAARQRCLDLAGKADDAQRRYEIAVRAATEARRLLEEAEAERAAAHKAARAAHAEAEKARREVGRLERS